MKDRLRGALLVASVMAAQSSLASPDDVRSADLRAELGRCARMASDAQRLACFDGLARSRAASPEAPTATGTRPTATTPAGPPPSSDGRAPAPQPETFVARSVRIEAIEERPYGERVFLLDDGARWTEQTRGRTRFRVGDRATLERTRLGGFVLVRDAGGSTRVRALQ